MQKKYILFLILPFIAISAYSQYYLDYGLKLGASNYLGDIGGKEKQRRDFIADLRLQQTNFVVGGFFRYRFIPQLASNTQLLWVRISGKDSYSLNPYRVGRNLHFRNDIYEFTEHLEFYIFKLNDVGRTGRYRTDFQIYLFGGASLIYSNPKAKLNGEGSWIALQPLQTEGVKYNKLNFSIPAGIGFYYTLTGYMNRKYRIGLELSWNTTFTDYLDDISTTYKSLSELQASGSSDPALAYDISNQTTQEIIDNIEPIEGYNSPTLKSYEPGDKRGDSEHNDAYLSATVTVSKVLRGRSKFYRAKHNWLLGRKKRKRRKSRAKF